MDAYIIEVPEVGHSIAKGTSEPSLQFTLTN